MTTTVKPATGAPPAPRTLSPETITDANRASVGGKAENLWHLTRQGFPVPPWFVVTTEGYREAQAQGGKAVPQPVAREVLEEYRRRFKKADGSFELVAVRSSAVGEDSKDASFAGQHETRLFVKGEESLLAAIVHCWHSAMSERAQAYRAAKGIDASGAAIAVVVQQMVFGDASAVMFTANPRNGRRDEVLVNAVYGAGEGLVSGAYDADSFTVRRGSGWLKVEPVRKPKKTAFDAKKGEGTVEVDVPVEEQERACLTREQAIEIAGLGERVERHYGRPQDLELAVAGGKVWLLQARPITMLPPDEGELSDDGFEPPPAIADAIRRLAQGRETIFDNSNIVESYSGVTTPLTFSFASRAYYCVYLQFCEVIGVPDHEILVNEHVLRNMIGLVKGRVYYNLRNWYRLIKFLPGYEFNKDFMAAMMGLKQTADAGEEAAVQGAFDRWLVQFPKMLFRGTKLGAHFYRIESWVEDFYATFRKAYGEYRDRDFDALSVDDLVLAYRDLEAKLLWSWKAPIINDFAAMIWYGVLRRLVSKWVDPSPGATLQNDLLCGEGGIESTEPTKRMMAIAIEARSAPSVAALLERTPDDRCMEAMEAAAREDPAVAATLEKLRELLRRFGDRCMNELKLESSTLKEEPRFLFSMIKNYMRQKDLDPAEMERREKAVRAKAEKLVADKLKFKPVKLATFRHVLANARAAVKNRENMRFARTRIFAVARRLFRAIGKQLAAARLLEKEMDVFYLELEELLALVEGRLTIWDLPALVNLRRAQFERWKREPVDDRFSTRGVYTTGQSYRNEAAIAAASADPGTLRGVGCCPGRVKHKVRVIHSPDDDMRLDKEILVAERTDPGWVPLYPSACGLLIERGSILSHSAIVARELGLPCVVGIRDLLKKVKDGDVVEMDGGEGVVRLNVDPAGAGPHKIA